MQFAPVTVLERLLPMRNCKDCEIMEGCIYLDVLRIVRNLQEKQKKSKINQDTLNWISKL